MVTHLNTSNVSSAIDKRIKLKYSAITTEFDRLEISNVSQTPEDVRGRDKPDSVIFESHPNRRRFALEVPRERSCSNGNVTFCGSPSSWQTTLGQTSCPEIVLDGFGEESDESKAHFRAKGVLCRGYSSVLAPGSFGNYIQDWPIVVSGFFVDILERVWPSCTPRRDN